MSKHKKTKQEKIIADLRRKLSTTQQTVIEDTVDINRKERKPIRNNEPVIQTIAYTPVTNRINPFLTLKHEADSFAKSFDYSYVYRDLRKTLVLTSLAIGLELVLKLIWR